MKKEDVVIGDYLNMSEPIADTSTDPLKAFIEEYEALCQKHGYFLSVSNDGEFGMFQLGENIQNYFDAQIIKLKEDAANVD